MNLQKNNNKSQACVLGPKKLTVFVSGLNYHTTEEEITNFFQKCGKIERVNLAKKDNNASNQGFCHIIYVEEEGYQNALALNGSKLDGRYLDIITAKGPTKIEKIKEKLKSSKNVTLFVRNIPYDTSEEEISNLFQKYGTIRAIRLPICREDPSKLKGICFIDFENPHNLIKALELDGFSLRGRFLKLDADISYDDATGTKIKAKNVNQMPPSAQTQAQTQSQMPQQMMTPNDPSYQIYYQNQQSWMNYNGYQIMPQQYNVIPPPGFAAQKEDYQNYMPQENRQEYYQEYNNGYAHGSYEINNAYGNAYPQETAYMKQYADFVYDPKNFEQLSRRDYNGTNMPEFEIEMEKKNTVEVTDIDQTKVNTRKNSDSDYVINPSGKLRLMIDENMSKELEEFRKNNKLSPKNSLKNSKPEVNENNVGVFAEAVLGLSTFVHKTTDPLDKVLNPFQKNKKEVKDKDNNSCDKSKGLAKFLPSKGNDQKADLGKKLSKFTAQRETSPKGAGFSLSRFWKKK